MMKQNQSPFAFSMSSTISIPSCNSSFHHLLNLFRFWIHYTHSCIWLSTFFFIHRRCDMYLSHWTVKKKKWPFSFSVFYISSYNNIVFSSPDYWCFLKTAEALFRKTNKFRIHPCVHRIISYILSTSITRLFWVCFSLQQ